MTNKRTVTPAALAELEAAGLLRFVGMENGKRVYHVAGLLPQDERRERLEALLDQVWGCRQEGTGEHFGASKGASNDEQPA